MAVPELVPEKISLIAIAMMNSSKVTQIMCNIFYLPHAVEGVIEAVICSPWI